MDFLNSYFEYSKSQRNGVLLLFILFIVSQVLFFIVNITSKEVVSVRNPLSEKIQHQLDSLSALDVEKKYKIKPFNPNYLSDSKAYRLGMSVFEIDRLFAYRKQGKYVTSKSEFQEITKVSDSLLNVLSVNFKFPQWVLSKSSDKKIKKDKAIVVKDINKATLKELRTVNGIGEKLAQRIVKYRALLSGFTYTSQLEEVWGVAPNTLKRLKAKFKILSKSKITKININTASAYELSKIIYINYKQAKAIVAYRDEVAEIQKLAELKKISDFPVDKFKLISLYLHAQ